MGLRDLNQNRKYSQHLMWLIPAIFIGLSILIMLLGEAAKLGLRYDRVWIGQGEAWRLVSGHFAHLSWSHLVLNSAGLLLVWFLVGNRYTIRSWAVLIVITLAIMDIAFWTLNPELYWYVGMSGMLHGLLAAGIVARMPGLDAESAVLLLLMLAKIGYEQFGGPVPGSEITSGGPVVVDAHLYGALGGAFGAILLRVAARIKIG